MKKNAKSQLLKEDEQDNRIFFILHVVSDDRNADMTDQWILMMPNVPFLFVTPINIISECFSKSLFGVFFHSELFCSDYVLYTTAN